MMSDYVALAALGVAILSLLLQWFHMHRDSDVPEV